VAQAISDISPIEITAMVRSEKNVERTVRSFVHSLSSAPLSPARRVAGGSAGRDVVGIVAVVKAQLSRATSVTAAAWYSTLSLVSSMNACGVLHLRHQMAGDEDRPALGRQPAHQVADPEDALRVEAVHRFVEHQDLRVAEQRSGDAQPLSHAQREALRPLLRHRGQADDLQHLADPALRDVVGLRETEQMVVRGPAAVDGLGVEQCADLPHRIGEADERLAVDGDGAVGRRVQPEDHPHGGGLARTVRAEESGHQPGADRERQAVDGDPVAVPFGEVAYFDHDPSSPRMDRRAAAGRA
jgi:hypothetical protein